MTMEKQQSREALIAAMAADMAPVQRVKPSQGAALIAFAAVVASVCCIAIFEFWTGQITGDASPFFWITNGLLLLLGASSVSGLVSSALPRVGSRGNAPFWSAGMLALAPISAFITVLSWGLNNEHAHHAANVMNDPATWYWECGVYGSMAGASVALAAVLFLRRGAPVSLERAGWLTGLAAGSLGALAYNITCPLDTLAHVAFWHTVPVLFWAVAGRLAVPHLIRW